MKREVYISKRFIAILLIMSILLNSLTGCGIGSKHLEVKEEANENTEITGWENVDDNDVTTWETAFIVSWSDVDEYSDWVYSELLFDDITDEMPIVDCRVLDYQSNGKYFDGEKVYQMVGDRFDINSFVAKYAIGTGVIVICVIMNVITAGISTPIACFFAGAADASVSMAIKGAAFGAATKAVTNAIKSGGDFEETLYGALEGSADGYMWGAIYGAVTGGFSSKYCFVGETLVETDQGMTPINKIKVGDKVYTFDEVSNIFSYESVTQVIKSSTSELIVISTNEGDISCTQGHLLLTSNGWKSAGELSERDYLINDKNELISINSITSFILNGTVDVYSLCVEKNHTFIVGNERIIVHNRCNPNEKFADSTRYFDEGSELAQKYPDGVYITPNGYPDFSPYAKQTVTFAKPTKANVAAGKSLRGDCYYDFKMANKVAFGKDSVTATPKGFTWHHCEDGITMQLIPMDLHRGIGHDGGEKVIALLLSNL